MPTNLKVFNHAVMNNKLHNNFFLTDPDLRARFWPNEPPHLNLVIVNLLKNTSNLIVKLKGLNFFLGLSPAKPSRSFLEG